MVLLDKNNTNTNVVKFRPFTKLLITLKTEIKKNMIINFKKIIHYGDITGYKY